jgi:phosphate transport system permease protein
MATESPVHHVPLAGGRRRPRLGDLALRGITGLAAVVLAALMVLLVYEVVREGWSSISRFRLGFITSTDWNAVTDRFGALDLIWGTLVTSLGALVIAVPMSIAIGVFLSELAPRAIRTPVTMLVELLAAIPSVVLGLWGILVMGPFVAEHVEPTLLDHFGWVPFVSGYASNQGLLPAILILTIMVVPIVASISRELFTNVPSDLKQGSLALGATRWEMVRSVMIPQVSGGLLAAVMLGFGRAVGEAIAVTQVIGGSNVRPDSLFGPADTMASRIAAQYAGSATSLQRSSLAYLAVILLVISLLTNLTAQIIAARIQRRMRGLA